MRNNKTAELVLTALFAAIIIIMAFTPLGYIPLVVINATIIHIPVILGSLFCGPKKGGFLGFIFGLTSFIKNTVMPTSLSAFVFSPVLAASMVGTSGIVKSAFICFVPRILVGILPYFVYIGVKKALSSRHKILWASVFNILIGVFLFLGARAFLLLSAFVFSPVLAASMVGTSGIVKSAFICFVPRILVGILPYFVYIGVKKALSSRHKILWASVFNILIGVFLFLGARAFLLHVFDKKPLSDIALYAVSALVGWFVFIALEVYTVLKSGAVCAFVYAGVTGAMVNTILVMGGIFVLYKDAYAKALSVDAGAVLGIIGGVISFNGVIEAIVAAIIVAALGMVLNKLKPIQK